VAQEQAIPLLLGGKTQREVASIIGVAEETLSRWVTGNEDFQQAYESARAALYTADLQYARSRLRQHLDVDDAKIQQGGAKILLEHHAQMAKANVTVTHTVILDKLSAAIQHVDADAVDAEYTALAADAGAHTLEHDTLDAEAEGVPDAERGT
jgi:transcriptional regulator with XRE-family HTH domain